MKRALMICKIVMILSIVSGSLELSGQDIKGTIVGKIIDDHEIPLGNMNVTILPTGKSFHTTQDGEFYFKHLKIGNYKIIASSVGYDTVITWVNLSGLHPENNLTIRMQQRIVKMKEIKVTTGKIPVKRALLLIKNTEIFAGKKTDLIDLENTQTNLSQNIIRTALARIPGLHVWAMDGAGTQVNVGFRGSNPHRSIEMNMRQNGYVTNSDIFGYPEDHYTPPLQGIKEIQLVRGSAALQFGSQFGGMMNYVMKGGDTSHPFTLESEQTIGSYNFFNSYNAVGGTVGKIQYYAYYDDRHGDGWREDARFNYHAYYADIRYHFNSRGTISFQFSRMQYVQQIAGGLTDKQFNENSQQSTRGRNFFNPEINIPAIIFDYQLGDRTHLNISSQMLFGQRNSVQYIANASIPDTFNTALNTFNPRQVDRDFYNSFSTEARLLHSYSLGRHVSTLTGGLRYSNGQTKRKQKGPGTIGHDFDLSLTAPYGINLKFRTVNYAVFAENLFQITDQFSLIPGIRYESINSKLHGVINHANDNVSYKGSRNFPLLGLGMEYKVGASTSFYGNWSQAYRPYLYADITPADRIDIIDPKLKDAKGYDIDLGYRGDLGDIFHFDVNAYYLYYGNRVGLLTMQNPDNSTYLLTTNVGNSVAKGVEAYLELSLLKLINKHNDKVVISVFNSLGYDHARYTSGHVFYGGKNISLRGNNVESAPDWINRTGINFHDRRFSTTLQLSYTAKSYSDANNTIFSPEGAVGIVPSYLLLDWSFSYQFLHNFHISGGLDNIGNLKYYTRRITMYPGPGILPADGRTFYLTLGIHI